MTVTVNGTISTDSDGQIVLWSWNFGNGQTGAGSTASYTYSTAGTYTITLTVNDNLGATNSTSNSVTVSAATVLPVSAFTYSAVSLLVSFNGLSSHSANGNIASWSWNFGDGQTGSGTTANHQYGAAGTYQVSLTVIDNKNLQATSTQSIQIVDKPPIANFTYSIGNNNLLTFTSNSSDPYGSIVSYSWSFGDGQTSGGVNTNHQYVMAGTYTVTLSVTDNYGGVGTQLQQITITNIPPVSSFTYSVNGLSVLFTSTSSFSGGTFTAYSWNFGDGQTSTSSGPLTHQYYVAGTYNVQLTVTTSNSAKATNTQQVTVGSSHIPPVAGFTFWTEPAIGHFSGTSSYDVDGSIVSYAWKFGDGTTGTGISPNHTYTTVGTFAVTLTVTDNTGSSNSISQPVTITNSPINIHIQSITSFTIPFGTQVKASSNILILDNLGNPAAGVTIQTQITGSWNYQSVNVVTGSNGIATVVSTTALSTPVTFQVCVNNLISSTLWYNSSANMVRCA